MELHQGVEAQAVGLKGESFSVFAQASSDELPGTVIILPVDRQSAFVDPSEIHPLQGKRRGGFLCESAFQRFLFAFRGYSFDLKIERPVADDAGSFERLEICGVCPGN